MSQPAGQFRQRRLRGPLFGQVAAQELEALGGLEQVEAERAEGQLARPVAAAGREHQADAPDREVGQPLKGSIHALQIVQDDQPGTTILPGTEGKLDLARLLVRPLGQQHSPPACGNLGGNQVWLGSPYPVHALKEPSVAVGELDGELGLADAAHALHSLGH